MLPHPFAFFRGLATVAFKKLVLLCFFLIMAAGPAFAQSGSTGLVNLKINFQDSATRTPVGWLQDFGQPFGTRTLPAQGSGNTYGWRQRSNNAPLNLTAYGRKRSSPADTLLATFMHLQNPKVPEGIWEIQVPNGSYNVTVSVGDASYLDSKHTLNIEGVPAIVNFVPTSAIKFKNATVTATVADGLLTVDAIGGTNTKINYIIVKQNPVAAAPVDSILFTQASQSVEVEQGGTQNLLEYISTSNGVPVDAQLNAADENGDVPTWLSVNGKAIDGISYTTGSEISFGFDATNLSVGIYSAQVTASALGYNSAILDVFLTVKAGTNGAQASLKINFQDSATRTPVGWLQDFGQPFGTRTLPAQGSGNTYGWIKAGTDLPLDLTKYGRKRSTPADTLLATFVPMQTSASLTGVWEAQVANGNYDVTVSVGDDAATDSRHSINVEGVHTIVNFVPTSTVKFKNATVSVTVADGLLTVDASGGSNTKINYISIQPSHTKRPSVVSVNPENASQNVSEIASVTADILNLPNGGVDNATITSNSVYLEEELTKAKVPAHVNGTGGGDAITLVPDAPLKLSTSYVFNVTDSVKDLSGASFIPYASTFTTGSVATGQVSNVKFQKIKLPNTAGRHSSLTIGPDGKLYALSIDGIIKRFVINPDGTLQDPELLYSLQEEYGPRQQQLTVGFAFDPSSTPDNLIAWVTHDSYMFLDAPDWDGKLTKLSGPNLEHVQDVLVNLPRSAKDHVTNSISFGPDGALYFTQGSTSAMGRADKTWGLRNEHLLSAAVLRLDTKRLGTSLPLDVKTAEGGGSYSPYAPGAPLTIYASGIRNAYDLVWHSNGELYVPTNGSAGGGNTPASVQGTLRPDGGTYNGPTVPALSNVQQTAKDFLFRVKQGGYYGHPNPLRGEYVMNGGNPTSAIDPAQLDAYPVGTLPDSNWRGYAFDFQGNKSPDGAIEYKSNAFGGALKGKLLVVRYSQNDDIVTLTPGGPNKDIVSYNEGASIQGFSGFVDPLDLTEDVRTGNIYVSEYGGEGSITLLRSDSALANGVFAPNITVSPKKIYDNDPSGGASGVSRVITIKNTSSTENLSVNSIAIAGTNADQFVLGSLPAFPKSLAPNASLTFTVAFNPLSAGLKTANVNISSNDVVTPVTSVPLRGLGTSGTAEPSLQALLNLHEISVFVGDDNTSTAVINSNATSQKAALLGDEVSLQRFVKADTGAVNIEPLAVFGSTASNPVVGMGWYKSGDNTSKQELFTVSNTPVSNGQTVNVNLTGTLSFDPGGSSFGFYSRWPYFANRHIYNEDALNTFSGAIPHHVRVYPFKDHGGSVVPFTYVVAFEENTSGYEYQDLVLVVRNVKPETIQPSTVILSPLADAYVTGGTSAAINYGIDTVLQLKGSNTASSVRRVYLKFPLSSVSDVLSAKLRLWGRNTENSSTIAASVFGVDNDAWTETGLAYTGAPAAQAGALGTLRVNNQARYYEVDVTAFVKAQFAKDKTVSLQVRDSTTAGRLLSFHSREHTLYPPQLVINTSATATPGNAMLFVENLDKFPSNEDYVASRLQIPSTHDSVTYNTDHDTVQVRLYNKGISPLVVSKLSLSNQTNWKLTGLNSGVYDPSALPLTINPSGYADLRVAFVAPATTSRAKLFLDELTIVSNDDIAPNKTLYLHGLWQRQATDSTEPYAQEIINAFGFKTKVGFTNSDPDTGTSNKPKGDEVLTSYFVRVDSLRPVTVRQMSAYHGDMQPESLRWFPKGATGTLKTAVSHIAEDAQRLLPRRSRNYPPLPSEGSFSPTTAFGFKIGDKDWSDTLLNPLKKVGIRVWKAVGKNGQPIPNAYIIANDYLATSATNYDYSDNIYYVTNVRPELGPSSTVALGSSPSAMDFGEQLLQSNSTFTLNLKSLGQTYQTGATDPALGVASVSVVGDNAGEFSASMPAKSNLTAGEVTTLNINFNPQSEGLKIADLFIYYNNANGPLRVPLYGIAKANGSTVTVPYRIKSGSSADMVVNGKTWKTDTLYAFDNLGPHTNTSLKQISATDDDVLYFREQSSNGDKKPFRYEMPLQNGNYWVRLHFAEIYWGSPGSGLSGGPGSRVMSVSIEGQRRLVNFDIALQVGSASAFVKNFPVTVSDGKLNINFSATSDRPSVCAVEVYQFTAGSTINQLSSSRYLAEQSSLEKPSVYPNPLHQTFTVAFPTVYKGSTLLKLVDAAGRVYELGKINVQAGGTAFDVDVSRLHLASGIYFLRIEAENRKAEVVKLLVQ